MDNLFKDFPEENDLFNMIMKTSSTVWNYELIEKNIKKWLDNFKGEVLRQKYERLLALWLLNHFTYYNENEVKHLCRVLYLELIHYVVNIEEYNNYEVNNKIESFFKDSNIISLGKSSESGGFIAYIFRTENDLPISIFNFSKDNIGNKINNLLVIDDVALNIGKAGQAYNFLSKLKNNFSGKNIFLVTLISNEKVIKYWNDIFNIKLICAIKIDDRDKCFHKMSYAFCSFPKLIYITKKFALHYGLKIFPTKPLGYNNGQYLFGFYYNTPDNTLPIFWGQINGWFPIVRRYEKNYNIQQFLNDERFI